VRTAPRKIRCRHWLVGVNAAFFLQQRQAHASIQQAPERA
jgi:hypothetical protein